VAGVNSVGTGTYSSTTTATPTASNSLTASGWSGAGTSASKLAPPGAFYSSSITVNVSGTLEIQIATIDEYNDDWEIIIYQNDTEIWRRPGNLNWGAPYGRLFAVTAGQTIYLDVSGGGAKWLATTRLWIR
jgi:hypothetical protein